MYSVAIFESLSDRENKEIAINMACSDGKHCLHFRRHHFVYIEQKPLMDLLISVCLVLFVTVFHSNVI